MICLGFQRGESTRALLKHSQELLLRAERGLGETASNPAHLGVGGRIGGQGGLVPTEEGSFV